MHPAANSVANIIADYRITVPLSMMLNRCAYVPEMLARAALLDCQLETFLSNAQQL
jgi:hypothetical protein